MENIQNTIDESNKYPLTDNVAIYSIEDDAFRYSGGNWEAASKRRMRFDDIITMYLNNVNTTQGIIQRKDISGVVKHHASYYLNLLKKFTSYVAQQDKFEGGDETEPLKNYVLIIDEINRANLPSVLGELIYALEYRGQKVESIYAIDDDKSLILPENLYIIGTMNTADRSVGHIDYAIRRRFAFVDVLPSIGVLDEYILDLTVRVKAKTLFNEVANLFKEGKIAPDFKANEVQLGHSYFLAKDEKTLQIKLEYEIKPLLREYLKDGILLEQYDGGKTLETINNLCLHV